MKRHAHEKKPRKKCVRPLDKNPIEMRILALKVGFFLAWRQILRSGRGTSILIVLIMTLTFLNLVVVNGILIGLVRGSSDAYRSNYSADVLITNEPTKQYIERTPYIVGVIGQFDEVEAVTQRYVRGGRVEANYREGSRLSEEPDNVGASIAGIDPVSEHAVTEIADRIVEGSFLEADSDGEIVIGSGLLAKYNEGAPPGEEGLPDVEVGDKVRIVFAGTAVEMKVRGILDSKIGEVNRRVFFVDRELRNILGRTDLNVNEIALKLKPGVAAVDVKDGLIDAGIDRFTLVQTWKDAQGQFFDDIESTFSVLGNVIGSIALFVAALTVFIVVLINALTRKRQIGIMKGIGICGMAINVSYVIQSLIFAVLGTSIGLALLYGFIKPYIDANPIDFPFSDGIIVAPVPEVMARVGILMAITVLAGYVPASMIVRKNTLNTILGR